MTQIAQTFAQAFAQTFAQTFDTALDQSKGIIEKIGESVFNTESIVTFIIVMILALVAGRMVAAVLRYATRVIGAKADKTKDLAAVTRLRRIETLIVLSIATIRTILVIFAIYFWWVFTHPGQQPTAILGAGAALTILLTWMLRATLSDVAAGAVMMGEHWYGVGDHIRVEPLIDAQGVVERITLRSTRLRTFSGEILWINNKDISAVSVTPRGVRTIAVELFAKNAEAAQKLVDDTNLRLPQGSLAVVSRLVIMTNVEVSKDLWHVTAISEVAPGREWLIDKFAIDIIRELDDKSEKTLVHEPISRYADSAAERRFARTILNARKTHTPRETVAKKVARKRIDHQAQVKKNHSRKIDAQKTTAAETKKNSSN